MHGLPSCVGPKEAPYGAAVPRKLDGAMSASLILCHRAWPLPERPERKHRRSALVLSESDRPVKGSIFSFSEGPLGSVEDSTIGAAE